MKAVKEEEEIEGSASMDQGCISEEIVVNDDRPFHIDQWKEPNGDGSVIHPMKKHQVHVEEPKATNIGHIRVVSVDEHNGKRAPATTMVSMLSVVTCTYLVG